MAPPSSPASRPLAAAVGLAVLGAQKAKDLPGRAVLASLSGVGAALSLPGILRREYDQLAAQGERVLARLNGRVEPDLPATGTTGARSGADVEIEDEWIARPVFPAPPSSAAPVFPAPPTGPAPVPVFPAPADPTPTAPAPADPAPAEPTLGEPDAAGVTVVDDAPDPTAHLEAVAYLVQDASDAVRAEDLPPGGDLQAGQLPLEDFDHLTLGSLRGRLRRLSVAELVQLREYEVAHGHRLPILSMLDNRIAKLEAERAAAAG